MSKHRAPVTTVVPTTVLVSVLLFLVACLWTGFSAINVSESWNNAIVQTISERSTYVQSQATVQYAEQRRALSADYLDRGSLATVAGIAIS